MKQTRLTKKVAIDPEKYANTETGETLASEYGANTCIQVPNGDFVKFKSKDFYMIERSALEYLQKHLSTKDLGYIYMISNMVYGSMNALYDKEMKAHTRETLMTDLELARTQFSGLINRLMKKGILYELKGMRGDKVMKAFILNPQIARRSNTIDRYTAELFHNLKDNI